MGTEKKDIESKEQPLEAHIHRVRLPGFLVEKEIGLGDFLKRTTYAIGVKPCAGCEKRASALNRWVIFTR